MNDLGCDHNWVKTNETATEVTHRCSKCGDTYTRAKGNRS